MCGPGCVPCQKSGGRFWLILTRNFFMRRRHKLSHFFPYEWGENCPSQVVILLPSNNEALGTRNSPTKWVNPLTNKLVSLVKLELPSKIHYQDIIWKEILGAIGWHLLVNFRKTLLEITYFKVIFKLRLLISNLASIYRLALIPVRLIMEEVLFF